LIAQTSFLPLVEPPRLLRAAAPGATRPKTSPTENTLSQVTKPSAKRKNPQLIAPPARVTPGRDRFAWAPGMVAVFDDRAWTSAPEYDDDHPDELAYRPFPIEPLMTASLDDPTLSRLSRPDNGRTLELLGQSGTIPRMRLRPPQQLAELMWRQEFSGRAVQLHSNQDGLNDSTSLNARGVTPLKQ